MDTRSVAFLEIMAAIAVVGVLAFLIYLIAAYAHLPRRAEAGGVAPPSAPRWYELGLAVIMLVAIVILVLWQFPPGSLPGLAEREWQTDSRSLTFFVVMLIAGGIGILSFIVFIIVRGTRTGHEVAVANGGAMARGRTVAPEVAASPTVETPSATRLVGILLLGIAFLLLNWIYVDPAQQFALMLYVLYPAGFTVALVLLLDKATRGWSVKTPGESAREWLFCDAIALLLVLGFLNLHGSQAGDTYASLFWDFLHIALFFVVFWLLDRKVTRYRFLVVYGYVILLPILLLIWRAVQQVPVPEELSWWSTIWPFFFLGIIFFALEIISLIATRETDNQTVGIVKDGVFVVIFTILLIVAIPEAAT